MVHVNLLSALAGCVCNKMSGGFPADAQFTIFVLVTLYMQALFINSVDKRLMYTIAASSKGWVSAGGGLEVAVRAPGSLVWCSGGWLSSSAVSEGCPGGQSAWGRVAGVPTSAKAGRFEVSCPGQAGGPVSWKEISGVCGPCTVCEHPIPSGTCHSFISGFQR